MGTTNDAGDLATGADTRCDDPDPNWAFLSPVGVDAALGGLAGADALCEQWATVAGIPGTYRAILSTTLVDARDRLAGARGWVRVDRRPLGDEPGDMFQNTGPLAALRIDSMGNDLGQQSVWSASSGGRYYDGGGGTDCTGWTVADTERAWYGFSDTTSEWQNRGTNGECTSSYHLYCFQIDNYHPLDIADYAETGKRMFVSSGKFDVTTGLAGADALCAADVASANLGGSFKALVASTGSSAISRFADDGSAVVTLDGLLVANDFATLSTGPLVHPPVEEGDRNGSWTWRVFTGAYTPDQAGQLSTTCSDWTVAAGNAVIGMSHSTTVQGGQRAWYGNGTDSCMNRSGALPVYCLEE